MIEPLWNQPSRSSRLFACGTSSTNSIQARAPPGHRETTARHRESLTAAGCVLHRVAMDHFPLPIYERTFPFVPNCGFWPRCADCGHWAARRESTWDNGSASNSCRRGDRSRRHGECRWCGKSRLFPFRDGPCQSLIVREAPAVTGKNAVPGPGVSEFPTHQPKNALNLSD